MGGGDLPTGTVAFLFTDIEQSTQLLRALGGDYSHLIAEHHRLLSEAFEANSGRVVDDQGDSLFAVFPRVRDAAAAAERVQRGLAVHDWPGSAEVRVRIGLHAGEPQVVGDRYVGLGVHRAARISAAAHGGQVLLSEAAAMLLADSEPADVSIRPLGEYELKDFDGPERISQLVVDGLATDFPPLKAPKVAEQEWSPRRKLLAATVVVLVAVAAVAAAAALLLGDDGAPSVVPESLVKIDAGTNEIVDVVPVGRNPGEVAFVGDYVFVASVEDATLSRVDTRTGDFTNSGRYSADGSIAAQGDDWLWAASKRRGEVSQVETDSLAFFASLPLPEKRDTAAIGVGGGSLWVSTGSPGLVTRWQLPAPHTLRLERRYPLRLHDWANGLAFGYGAAWVSLGAPANDLLRIDAQSGRATRIPVGNLPGQLAVGFGSVWVSMWDDDKVWRIDPVTGRARGIVKVGGHPMGVAVGAGSVWVTNHCDGTVSRIDPDTDMVVETIEIGFHPQWIAVGRGFVWVGISGHVYFEMCA
jgi:YVTN family beta-propeller protein